ncbi:MAG: response regulator transcription factor [Cycloclasticus sp.]|nr:response regulator transcription factor [Cycloclasticus sp.]
MRILIADDEPLARQRLKLLAQEICPNSDIYADASNGLEALKQCIELQPDIALLDIRMPIMDGLQAAAEISKAGLQTHVVFVTAYDQYALEAFDKNAIDYLLKPIRKDRLERSIEKISRMAAPPANTDNTTEKLRSPRQQFCAHTHHGLKVVAAQNVLFFKADNKYVLACTANDNILLDESLKKLEEEFSDAFFRIHRNALVKIAAIKTIEKSADGSFEIHLHACDERLTISRRHQAELNRLLRQKNNSNENN